MPLYECERCGTCENTALTRFWWAHLQREEALCSECETGVWHGQFPKRSAAGYVAEFGEASVKYRAADLTRRREGG